MNKAFTFLLAIALCLTACAQPQQSPGLPVAETGEPAIQHITQQVCDNLLIDADVIIPGKAHYSTYTLKQMDWEPERLFGIFSPEGYGAYTQEPPSYPGEPALKYTESSGKRLVIQDIALSYYTYKLGSNDPMQEISNLLYYYTTEHPKTQPHDLSFMAAAEVESFGSNILTQLGVPWEPKLSKCVTLSGQEILDFQKEMFGKSTYTEFGTPVKLTEATDSCYLEFTFSYDGIPLYGTDEPACFSYEEMRNPANVSAAILFNADGIQDFCLMTPNTVESVSEPQSIITLDEAIAVLQRKFEEEILYEPLTITDIWMEYVPIWQESSVVLTPYWCFARIDKSQVGKFGYWGDAVRFNAFTGEDMAYGG